MLFKWELIEKIVAGLKTQTRRPVGFKDSGLFDDEIKTVYTNGRIKWQVGRDYAVQYGMGLPTVVWSPDSGKALPIDHAKHYWANQSGDYLAPKSVIMPLRIKLTDIRYEDVRNISHEDSIAEGFPLAPKYDFLHTWVSFYDKPMKNKMESLRDNHKHFDFRPLFLFERPDKFYQAWALSFEVVLP